MVSAKVLRSADEAVATTRPEEPMHCIRPDVFTATAANFTAGFPGTTLYAVKCNPDPEVLRALWAGGVRHFDCASPAEIELVRDLFPSAVIHFMHPVKSRSAIREAWALRGVRDFVLDSPIELSKILTETEATGIRGDLGLVIRLALPKGGAALDLSGKFGANNPDAVALLRAARPVAARLGISFHVGSQCEDPLAWQRAIEIAGATIGQAGVDIDIIDVGGGFPVDYPGRDAVQPLSTFFAVIEASFKALGLSNAALWAEPGRALVAAGGSVVVQVQLRRGDALYINDGVYGTLADAGALGFRYPTRMIRPDGAVSGQMSPFRFYGPTCDSADVMAGPFYLPDDIEAGDWIEVSQLGAYGNCLRTGFNGFDRSHKIILRDSAPDGQ